MASDAFSEGGPSQRPTVQVGDPFMEKLLLEACLEIFAADLLVGVQDMGAAGLTSSSIEMAGRSGSGLDLDLDAVPRRTRGLTPYEMLLSESQERMLMVAKPGHEARVFEICRKWELDAAVIGRVTDTGRWVVRATPGYDPFVDAKRPEGAESVVVCDLPVDFLTDEAPKYDRPQADDPSLPARHAFDPSSIVVEDLGAELLRLAGSPNLGSRRWVWRQYDSIVRGGTRVRPGSDAAVVRVPCEAGSVRVDKFLAFASDCNGRLCELDPFEGGKMAVAEVCRNLACVGAEPIGITDCLNFGNPERPEIMRQIARAIDGLAEACRALEVPVVSGNVSLYNETEGRAILPTPTVAAVGIVASADAVVEAAFPREGLVVLLLGATAGGPLGGSSFVADHTGEVKGPPPKIDLALEAKLQKLVRSLVVDRKVASAHDVSEGGLAVALAECCTAVDDPREILGATLALPAVDEPLTSALFGEAPSRVVVSAAPGDRDEILRRAKAAGVGVTELGVTGGAALAISRAGAAVLRVDVARLHDARERCLEPIVGV
jgi:phosphoribosylformylglycinamidine synthase